MAAGQFIAFADILLDLEARLRHTRRVCEAQVLFGGNGNSGNNFDFSFPFAMQAQGFLSVIQGDILLPEIRLIL